MTDMLIFGLFEGSRASLDIPIGATVGSVKEMFRDKFLINMHVVKQENKVLVLSYGGSDLEESWIFTDLGIVPGTTVKVCIKNDVRPALFVRCSHNNETINIMDEPKISRMPVTQFRSIVSRKSGLPVGIYRLVSPQGREMYDPHTLGDYSVKQGDIISLETWDGWNEFLNYCRLGFTQQALEQISSDEILSKYQMKVALFIAAHFGNLDLARCLIRQGVRADDAVGEHPSRLWCRNMSHVETMKSPVHEATQMGQLGVLRLFTNHDITVIMARDGHGLAPLNIALRNQVKNCASFLLTKQWSKINVTKTFAVNVVIYTRIRRWCERAKERVFLKFGQFKSSVKKRSLSDPLVGHGVLLDGFSESPLTGKAKAALKEREKRRSRNESASGDPIEAYFKSTPSQSSLAEYFGKTSKLGALLNRCRAANTLNQTQEAMSVRQEAINEHTVTPQSSVDSKVSESTREYTEIKQPVRLPPILNKIKSVSVSTGLNKKSQNEPQSLKKNKATTSSNKAMNQELSQSLPNVHIVSKEKSKASKPTATFDEIDEETVDEVKRKDVGTVKPKKKKKTTKPDLLLSNAKTADMDIPLPIVSNEVDSRPFFYLNGLREEDFIEPVFELVSSLKSGSSRDRALQSLSIANSFKDKPWLARVRMAMSLTSRGIKGTLGRPRSNNSHVTV